MNIIKVDFRDKELYQVLKKVEEQLKLFGFDLSQYPIPEDAIACALDEVKQFASLESRRKMLEKIEEQFKSREAEFLLKKTL